MSAAAANDSIVKLLVLKDWYFHCWAIAGYLATGALALVLLGIPSEAAFFAGSILIFTVLIALGIHLVMSTVIQERAEKNLPFIMSLPVSPRGYTRAKILANVLIFLVPFLALVIGAVGLIAGRAELPDGLIPFAIVLLMEIFVGYCLVLAVALVSESQGWTIGAIVTGNLGFQAFLYWVSHIPSVAATMKGPGVVWSPPLPALLLAEIVAILVLLGLTFALQARKKDFL